MGLFNRLERAKDFAHAKFERFLREVRFQEDVDRVFSYYTKQQVHFMDWKLGLTFWIIQVFMAVVVVGYVLIYNEGYLEYEQAKGATINHVAGDAVAQSLGKTGSRYFSTEELTYPGLENGNVFIATKLIVHRQMRGYCEDPDMPCITDVDCMATHGKGTCTSAGLCRVYSWCNIGEEVERPEMYEIPIDTVQIWSRSFIQFVKLSPELMFTSDFDTSEPDAENTFSVRQLLMKVKPLPIMYEEVARLGGLFEVGMRWECNLNRRKRCEPEITVRRLDTMFDSDHIGYSFKYAEYIDGDHRIQNEVHGLRFLFRTTGVGKKFSVSALVTTGSVAGSLMSMAIVVADLLLTKVFANRSKYIARKYEKTADFSEFIKELEERRKESTLLIDIEKAEQQTVDKEAAWMRRWQEEDG
jgi:hypothetical protein